MPVMSLRQASAATQGNTQEKNAGDTAEVVKLTSCYHNLVRMWAST